MFSWLFWCENFWLSRESYPWPPNKKEEKVWHKGWDREGTVSCPQNASHWPPGLEAATILSIATNSKLIWSMYIHQSNLLGYHAPGMEPSLCKIFTILYFSIYFNSNETWTMSLTGACKLSSFSHLEPSYHSYDFIILGPRGRQLSVGNQATMSTKKWRENLKKWREIWKKRSTRRISAPVRKKF